MTISQTPAEILAGQTLQRKCELETVRLGKCKAELLDDTGTLKKPFLAKLSHSSTAMPRAGGLTFSVAFECDFHDSSADAVTFCAIQCAFTLSYTLSDKAFEATQESIEAFKEGNAIFNCWPYAREFIQNTAARMNLNPPPLPLLRVIPNKQKAPTESAVVLDSTEIAAEVDKTREMRSDSSK